MAISQSTVVLLAICSGAVIVSRFMQERRKNQQLPPGPKPLPIIGNALDMPTQRPWEAINNWSQEHNSDIIYVNALGTRMLFLNSYSSAIDLLEKRSGIYSSRPYLAMINLSGLSKNLSMLPYGDMWRASRRLLTKHLSPSRPELTQPRELKYVRQFLVKLAENPQDYMKHIRYLVGANALSSMYGLEIRPNDDPYLEGAEVVVRNAAPLTVAGAFLVDTFPILKYIPTWFPGAKFHQTAQKIKDTIPLVREVTFAATVELMKSGKYDPCLATNGLEELEAMGLASSFEDVDLLKEVCEQGFLAAADTTVSAITTFFLAMVRYPEVQKKVQADLDEALQGELPNHEHIKDLPYLQALVLEVFRWHPVLPVGIPHLLVGDDTYRGYHIPNGTIAIPNHWAMLHDEDVYPDPSAFKPERFLDATGQINTSIRSPMDIAFGFGRRICPGRHLAHSLLTFAAASVLSTFDILKQIDKDGQEVPVHEEFETSVISQPLNFPCWIKPRSREAAGLVDDLRNILDLGPQ